MSELATSRGGSARPGGADGDTSGAAASLTDAPGGRRVDLLLFAAAREAAGTRRDQFVAASVADVLDQARTRYGPGFAAVADASRVWVNGEPADADHRLGDGDEVAVLPPVSGG